MNTEGQFTASFLASEDGLPVAAVPSPCPYDVDTVAAMVSLVKEFIQRTQTRLGLAAVDEVSIVVEDRSRLVCRYMEIGAHRFILAVITPPQHAYRRLMTRAIHEMSGGWTASSEPG